VCVCVCVVCVWRESEIIGFGMAKDLAVEETTHDIAAGSDEPLDWLGLCEYVYSIQGVCDMCVFLHIPCRDVYSASTMPFKVTRPDCATHQGMRQATALLN
jgi:hypothetical protein